jgi:maltodextrin utilization protein YvdJ
VIYINAALLQPYAIHHAYFKSLTKPDLLQEVIEFIGDESFLDDSTIKQTRKT